MDKMKMLNDEELEKVVGGATQRYRIADDGRLKILTPDYCACGSLYFVCVDGGSHDMPNCKECVFFKREGMCVCTNPDFIAEVTNG